MPRKKDQKPGRGAGGDDAEDDDDDELDDDDKPLTRSEGLKLVNSAVSAQLARKVPAMIEAGMSPVTTSIEEIKTLIAGGGQQPTKGKGKKGKRKDEDDEDEDDAGGGESAAVKALTKQVELLTGKLKASDEAALKAEKDRREANVQGKLREGLGKLKVDGHRMKGALAVVREFVKIDDKTGDAKWIAKRDGYDDELDIEEGLKEWADTDEGKSYQAPSGSSGGTGTRQVRNSGGAGGGKGAGAGQSKAERVAQAKQDLMQGVASMLSGGVVDLGGNG